MARKNKPGENNKKDKDKKSSKGNKKHPKKKGNQKVYYPTVIAKKHTTQDEEEPMSEAEISYKDKLMAVKMEQLAKKGLNNEQIIKALGIHRTTFYDKLKSEPYFSYCLYKHRGVAVSEVECALFNSAKGFMYTEQQATPMGVFEVKKYALPNVSAQKEFLHNRAPDEWKKKIEPALMTGQNIENISVTIRRREE